MADNEPYVILDIKGLLQHSYHAGKDPEGLEEADGTVVNTAAHAFHTFMDFYPILTNVPPRRIIAVWDGGNNYRRNLFDGYKAKRKQRSEEERASKPVQNDQIEALYANIKQLFMALGITQVRVDGVEADDMIARLVEAMDTNPLGVYTVDEDLHQLSSDRVTVYIKRLADKGAEPVVEPGLIALYKSLVGDTSDEYPGVKGIGPKGWENLVAEFGIDGMHELKYIAANRLYPLLEQAMEYAPDQPQLKLIHEQFEHWGTMYQLAILHPEICEGVVRGKVVKPQWVRRVPGGARLQKALTNLGAYDLVGEFAKWLPLQRIVTAINESPELKTFMAEVVKAPICAFDYETYDDLKHQPFQDATKSNKGNFVDMLSQRVTGASFCFGDNYQHVMYMPCRHKTTEKFGNWAPEHIAWAVRYAQQAARLVAHNATFEMIVSYNDIGLEEMPTVWDTRLMASHVDEDELSNLKFLSKKWLNYDQQTYRELMEAHGLSLEDGMKDLTAEEVLSYGCDDSVVTAHLFDLFWLVTKVEGTWEFVRDKEFESVHELVRGFQKGVKLDTDRLARLTVEHEKTVEDNNARLKELLTQNAKEYNTEGATTLFLDLWRFEEAKLADATDGEKAEKQQALWDRCYFSSKYIPYQEVREAKEVKPTPGVLTKTMTAIGLEAPKIEKTTKKFFNEDWFPVAEEQVSMDEELSHGVAENKREFVNLVRNCINESAFKKPDHEAYQGLANYCAKFVGEQGKVTKVGDELNFDSPNQMQELLYCKMGLPIKARSKVQHGSARDSLGLEGSPATDETAVAFALADDVPPEDWRYEALNCYLDSKKASTQLKLFMRPLPMWVHPTDGMLHPQIKNCGTVTRRPSGSSPNMLQLTKKDGGKLRSAFVAPSDDFVIVSADWNGQELRIIASESRDEALLDAYIGEQRKDVHSVTASGISDIFTKTQQFRDIHGLTEDPGKIDYDTFMQWQQQEGPIGKAAKAIRFKAKGVNFTLTYLGTYIALAKNLRISGDLAKTLMDAAFKRYPGIISWQERVIEFAKVHGYSQTAYGNRRHADPRLFSKDGALRSRMERQLVNATVQGCAADILKEVLSRCHNERVFTNHGAHLIAPIYDEIVAAVPRGTVVGFSQELKEVMEVTPPGHAVPMVAEFSYGARNFGEIIEVGSNINEDIIMGALSQSEAA